MCWMPRHGNLGLLNVPSRGVEHVAVDQQGPHRLAGRVPVRHLMMMVMMMMVRIAMFLFATLIASST